ncbi:M48 family metallopeptidase [Halorhodospira halophila]|uniref:M48 family metallopeptidase n=1 Tax=Halorhodospira halophila TaxID=1053 RepID=UPI001913B5D9|nr:SprT family zinc-dependent metalloprotease [Halorhodospira halophila]MBK5944757.1 metal-dependent hydrolase [Halorhodospira halophila]
MTTERRRIEIRGIAVDVDRKPIKNLHVGVYPPDGYVRVAAPERMDDEAIRLAVVARLRWIQRQQKGFVKQARQSQRQFVTGESHYFRGKRYNLDVVEGGGNASVRVRGNRVIELCVRPETTREHREQVIYRWYRRQLRAEVGPLVEQWAPRLGIEPPTWGIRKMKTKWGSCNTDAGRIWVNLELAKKPRACVEYILVHELVHLLERRHTDRFRELMDTFMPDWRLRRDELNAAPLAHEHWGY